jgi:hypothetical protein
MTNTMRHILSGFGISACLALAACGQGSASTLTVEGTYSNSSEPKCQVALRNDANAKLQQSHELGPSFREDFEVSDGKGMYYVEIQCGGGKMGRSPAFEFEPPRARITLNDIEIR